jgi:hypothetical protein
MLLAAGEAPADAQLVVTPDLMRQAIRLVERFRQYAKRLFGVLDSNEEQRITERILRFLRKKGPMKSRELQRSLGSDIKATALRQLLDSLRSLGIVNISPKQVVSLPA